MERIDSKERRILTLTCCGHFLSHFNMLVFPAILIPLSTQLGMDMAYVLGLSFWMYLLFGITALPWGMAADRWGATVFLSIFYAGAGICGLMAAFFIDSPLKFSLCLAGIGLFSGIYHPVGLGWISKDIKRVSLGMAYNGMFGNLGLATAPLLAGLVNWIWSPKAVYIMLGIVNFAGLILMSIAPKSASDRKGAETKKSEPDDSQSSVRGFLVLLVAMMLGGIAYRGATVIMPAWFEIRNQDMYQWFSSLFGTGISKNLLATISMSFIYFIGMIGQYTGGHAAERFDLKLCYLLFHMFTIPAAFLMTWAFDIPLIILSLVYFFFLLGMQPVENTLVAKFTPARFHHSAYGAKFVLTFGVGSFSVKMIEIIKAKAGIAYVFPCLGTVSIILICVIILMIFKTPPLQSHDKSFIKENESV
ncbi:MFS transporter [Desulfobacterales bacterium HSG16]|nr:MFS transporter [Desulfobacterales bacterium HSG16]